MALEDETAIKPIDKDEGPLPIYRFPNIPASAPIGTRIIVTHTIGTNSFGAWISPTDNPSTNPEPRMFWWNGRAWSVCGI